MKNDETGRFFKALTRISEAAALRNDRQRSLTPQCPSPSYLIECLVWNVPNALFGHDTLKEDVRIAIANLWGDNLSTHCDDEEEQKPQAPEHAAAVKVEAARRGISFGKVFEQMWTLYRREKR